MDAGHVEKENRILEKGSKKKGKLHQANNMNSAFTFLINLFIIQGCQSGSVGQGGQVGQVGLTICITKELKREYWWH